MPGTWPSPPAPGGDGFDELDLGWLRARPGEKWAAARDAGDDVLPCWVADMDFPAPWPARQALADLARGGDLGYPAVHEAEALEPAFLARAASKFGWSPRPGRLRAFCDIIQAVQAVLHVSTAPGDGVMLFTPAYPPFVHGTTAMGRRVVPVPAVDDGRGWVFDLGAAEAGAAQARALLLVNPHNPTGRMLSRAELATVADIALRHHLPVISDEVHADLALVDRRHVPIASLSPEVEARTVTLYSASKSHNLAGMRGAVAHMGNQEVEAALQELPPRILGRVSLAAVAATLACWAPEGDRWLEGVLERLRSNREAVRSWLAGPGAEAGLRGYAPEATYLSWLDFRGTSVGLEEDPSARLLGEARVLLSGGPDYGPGGAGFARLNFATSPKLLDEILGRLGRALGRRGSSRAGA